MENMEQAGSGHGSPRSRFPSGELEVIKKGMKEMMNNMLTFQKKCLLTSKQPCLSEEGKKWR
jgi:hypothetical protein